MSAADILHSHSLVNTVTAIITLKCSWLVSHEASVHTFQILVSPSWCKKHGVKIIRLLVEWNKTIFIFSCEAQITLSCVWNVLSKRNKWQLVQRCVLWPRTDARFLMLDVVQVLKETLWTRQGRRAAVLLYPVQSVKSQHTDMINTRLQKVLGHTIWLVSTWPQPDRKPLRRIKETVSQPHPHPTSVPDLTNALPGEWKIPINN